MPDAWDKIITRARAIWARGSDLPYDAASSMDRSHCVDQAVKELDDEGVHIPERYR